MVKACYHGSWTHPSEKADSQLSGHTASEVECKQESLHTPALPDHTAAELLDTKEAHKLKKKMQIKIKMFQMVQRAIKT